MVLGAGPSYTYDSASRPKDDYASGGVQAPPRSKCYCPSGNTTCKFTSAKHFCRDGEIEKYVDTMLSRTLRVTVDLFSLS